VSVNVAQLSATSTVEVQQDLLVTTMNTTVSGQDAYVVQTQLKQALDAALVIAGPAVQPGQLDVRTGNFSLYLTHDKNGKVNGWQGSTELVLNGRDFSRITATAGKIKSLTLADVSFGLSREQRAKVEDEAQAIAIERFKAKALAVSEGFGFSAYTLREIRISADNQGGQYHPASDARMAESPVPVEAGKATVLINVSGSVHMR
jgi:predicted secreted protein